MPPRSVLGLGVILCAVLAAVGHPPQAPAPRPVDVAALVRMLGSEDFGEREAAVKRLSTLSVAEVPVELLAALKSDNPEIRDRAAKAVKALREHIALAPERAAIARMPRAERFARRGQIDLYVASTAAGDANAKDDDRLWVPAFEAGLRAVEKAEMTGAASPRAALPGSRTTLRFGRLTLVCSSSAPTTCMPLPRDTCGVTTG